MASEHSRFGTWTRRVWDNFLRADNHIIGFVICVFAIFDWLAVYDGMDSLALYFSQGVYTLPSLSVLNSLFRPFT